MTVGFKILSRIWSVTILVIVTCSYSTFGAAAGGGAMKAPNVERKSPDQLAIENYNAGLRHRDKAWRHHEKVATGTREKDRTKYQKRANKEFGKAAKPIAQLSNTNLNSTRPTQDWVMR